MFFVKNPANFIPDIGVKVSKSNGFRLNQQTLILLLAIDKSNSKLLTEEYYRLIIECHNRGITDYL